jgi:hypothetical protein
MAVPSENEFQLEARIIALEYLVKECLQSIIRMCVGKQAEDGDNDKDIDIDQLAVQDAKILRLGARELSKASFPDLDPVRSDHLSALVRDHALRVLKELVQEMEERLNNDRR